MLQAERLRTTMAERGLSQSELARRVGVTQTTIRKLVTGTGYGSKYLHRIARELGTTPAFLEGETDDPTAETPTAELTHEQRILVELFEGVAPKDRAALTQLARTAAAKASAPQAVTLQDLLPGEEALAQMFEALLMAMDRSAPLGEQARLLARRLPIGLSQLQDLLPAAPTPADATQSQPRPTPVPEPQ